MILLAIAILFNILGVLQADEGCGLFTFGKCDPNTDLIIGTQTLPCTGLDLEVCADVCQNLCKFTAGCNFFSFHSTSNECVLMQEDQLTGYIASCSLVSGPSSPSLPSCSTGALAPCDVFINEDCDYEGNVIFSSENVVSSTDCQALLSEIGQTFGAHLFIHDVDDDNSCQFLDSSSFKCSAISGPADPPILDCPFNGTTTPKPVSTTTPKPVSTTTPKPVSTTTSSDVTTTPGLETTTNPVATTVQLEIITGKAANNQILGNVTVYVYVGGQLYKEISDWNGYARISIEGHLPFSFNFVGVKEGYHQYSGCHHLHDESWSAKVGMFLQEN